MKKIILPVSLILMSTGIFSQYGTGDNTTAAEFAKILKAAVRSTRDTEDMPDSFSLKKYAPVPQHQGPLETCVGWSTAYAARTISYAIKNNWTNADIINKYTFSPGYIYYKIKDPTDKKCNKGSSILSALEIMKKTGVMLKKEGLADCAVSLVKTTELKKTEPYKIKNFSARNATLGKIEGNDILEIKKSLTEKKPVVISLKIDESFKTIPASGIWPATFTGTSKTGHAMCIVGYNDSIGRRGSFEVMNSWGTAWGNKGFFWLGYEQTEKYGNYALELGDYESGVTRGSGSRNLEISGNIEFLKVTGSCKNGEKTSLPVTRSKINEAGMVVPDDMKGEFIQYQLTDILKSGSKFQIKFSASTQSYIYIFAQDNEKVISPYFPQNNTISAAINSPNTNYYLPGEYQCGQLNTQGKENICILYSKSEINSEDLIKYIKDKKTNIIEAVKFKLGKKLINVNSIEFNEQEIKFRAPADENSVLCFFVEMKVN